MRRYACIAAALAACVGTPADEPPDAVRIGALLPFTGEIAATGTNIERALILAADRLNAAGGVAGRKVRIVARDDHSDPRRGLEVARQMIVDEGIRYIVGPENEELARRMLPLIKQYGVVQISGGVTSPTFTTADDGGFWFRTNGSALVFGRALAARMRAEGVRRAVVLYVGDEYGTGFANVVVYELTQVRIQSPAPLSFQPDERSYRPLIEAARASAPDAVVLIAHPKSGAAIVSEWAILGPSPRWFLAPSLRTDELVANVPPGLLGGAIGVAPSVAGDSARFVEDFSARFGGDVPLGVAFRYFDAAALLGLAIASASNLLPAGQLPTGDLVRDQLHVVSRPSGDLVAWYELDRALELLGAGRDVDYRGASGDVDLTARGDVETTVVEYWTVQDDRIVTEGPTP